MKRIFAIISVLVLFTVVIIAYATTRFVNVDILEDNSVVYDNLNVKNYQTMSVIPTVTKPTGQKVQGEAKIGNIEFVQQYLLSGGFVDRTDEYRKSLLTYAVEGGQVDMVIYLIENGANPNSFDEAVRVSPYMSNQLKVSAVINDILESAKSTTKKYSDNIMDSIKKDDSTSIKSILSLKTAMESEVCDELFWYILGKQDRQLFEYYVNHPSVGLNTIMVDAVIAMNTTNANRKEWIKIIRKRQNDAFYAWIKYDYISGEDNMSLYILEMACAQGNVKLVEFILATDVDPLKERYSVETILERIGTQWPSLNADPEIVIPVWPTENDEEIRQLLQAHIDSH